MASEKQIRANRENARRSTGPRSEEGKAVVRLNAVKHGTLAEAMVLPFTESEEEWEEHRRGILGSIDPVGHVESALAERVAMLLWRLRRAARYERGLIATEQEAIEEKELRYKVDATTSEQLRRDAENARATFDLLDALPQLRGDAEAPAIVAMPLIEAAWERAKGFDLDGLRLPDTSFGINDIASWSAEDLRWVIKVIAEHAGTHLEGMLESVSIELRYAAAKAEASLKYGSERVEKACRRALLPDPKETDRISRYEAHLDRCLYKALHELQRLQAMRLDRGAALPIAVDVNAT